MLSELSNSDNSPILSARCAGSQTEQSNSAQKERALLINVP
jgi:hypothetical protein